MPTDLDDVETGGIDLFFGGEAEGETFMLLEPSVFEADEVRDELGTEVPKFGRWLPVHLSDEQGKTHGSGWVTAVGELVEELQGLEADPVEVPWTVTRCEKSGTKDTDPYEVNVEIHDDLASDQERF
jgi:hypothetical protein